MLLTKFGHGGWIPFVGAKSSETAMQNQPPKRTKSVQKSIENGPETEEIQGAGPSGGRKRAEIGQKTIRGRFFTKRGSQTNLPDFLGPENDREIA